MFIINNNVCEICGSTKNVYNYKNTGKYYCGKHRRQMNVHGMIKDKIKINHICEICSSNNHVQFNSQTNKYLCGKHTMQIRTHGRILKRTQLDPNEFILYDDYAEIIIYNRKQEEIARAIIDLEDVEKCKKYKWGITNKYATTKTKENRILKLHRFLLDIYDEDIKIDHCNRNRLDNRKNNLRTISQHNNTFNSNKKSNNKSGYIGVSWYKAGLQWRSYITIDDKTIHLGYFKNKEEAIVARLKAELKYFGAEFAPQRHLFDQYGIEINGGV